MTKGAMAALSAGVAVFGFDPEPGTPASRALHVLTVKRTLPTGDLGPKERFPEAALRAATEAGIDLGGRRGARGAQRLHLVGVDDDPARARSVTVWYYAAAPYGPVPGPGVWSTTGRGPAPRRCRGRGPACRARPASGRHPPARRRGRPGRRRLHRRRPAPPPRGPPRWPRGQRADLPAADPGVARFRRAPARPGHRGGRATPPGAAIPLAGRNRRQAPRAAPLLGRRRRGRAAGSAQGTSRGLIRATRRRPASQARRWSATRVTGPSLTRSTAMWAPKRAGFDVVPEASERRDEGLVELGRPAQVPRRGRRTGDGRVTCPRGA